MTGSRTGTRRRRRWQERIRLLSWQRNLYIIVAAEVAALMAFGIAVPFLPFYIQELGTTAFAEVAFWVGVINSAAPVSMALASPVWGVVADRHGRKLMLVRSLLGGCIILSLMALAANPAQLAILRIVQGALSGSVAAATTLVATTVPAERRGYALGLLQTAIFAGNSLGPFAGGAIAAILGYRAVFLVAGGLLLVAFAVVAAWVHEEFVPPPPRTDRKANGLSALQAILAQPILATMLGMLMLNSVAGMVTNPVLPLYVQTLVPDTRAASTATGSIIGATALANAAAAVWVGRSAERLGRRRILLTCLCLGALSYLPQMLTRHPWQLLALRAITGLTMGGVIPVANSVIAECAPEGRQGSIYGVSASLNAAGRAIGPMIGTLVITNLAVAAVFPVTGALLGLGCIVVALATRRACGLSPRKGVA